MQGEVARCGAGMIRALILIALMITSPALACRIDQGDGYKVRVGCSGEPVPTSVEADTIVQVDAYPLMVINGRVTLWGELTKQQQRHLIKTHLPGVITEDERKALRYACGAQIGDGVTTAIALSCTAVREMSPLLGSHPTVGAIIAAKTFSCAYLKWDAKQTHAYNDSAGYIRFMGHLTHGASLINLGTIAGASGCL